MSQKHQLTRTVVKQTMADQVAIALKESILSGEWQPGDALPTEPELAEIFGVSRAVIRDATRMLAARGLVEARHGKGVFVTESQAEAFGDALLLALRREKATVWDVEHFEQIMYPEVFALAAGEATDAEIDGLREEVEVYLRIVQEVHGEDSQEAGQEQAQRERLVRSFRAVILRVFEATHNQVVQLLAEPLLRLRNVRSMEVEEATPDNFIEVEQAFMRMALDAIASRDPENARQTMRRLMRLPDTAIAVMKNTPVGEVPRIQLGPKDLS